LSVPGGALPDRQPRDDYADLLDRVGPYTRGKGCVYLKRVDRADPAVLRAMIERSHRAATGAVG
jgi:hypothetical protein